MGILDDIGGYVGTAVQGLGNLLGGSKTDTNAGGWSGFLHDIISPQTIAGGITAFAGSKISSENTQATADALDAKYAHEDALADKTFQQQIELLKLKAALGGGGGGGGGGSAASVAAMQIAANKALARYQALLDAKTGQIATGNAGTQNIMAAYQGLGGAATAPLLRR